MGRGVEWEEVEVYEAVRVSMHACMHAHPSAIQVVVREVEVYEAAQRAESTWYVGREPIAACHEHPELRQRLQAVE